MSEKPLEARAPGKLLLFGEHAAVYGYGALGTTVRDEIACVWVPGKGESPLSACPPWYRAPLGDLLDKASTLLGRRLFVNGTLHIGGALGSAGGYGSSAALSTAVFLLAHRIAGLADPDRDTLWRGAHELEHIFHAHPSGIDTGLSSSGGLIYFAPRDADTQDGQLPSRRLVPPLGISLVHGSVARTGTTKSLVGELRNRANTGDKDLMDKLKELGRLGGECLAVGQGDPVQVGELVQRAQVLLHTIGLGNTAQDALFAEALRLGATGAKLSGAGGGGAFFVVARHPDHAAELCRGLESFSLKEGVVLASRLQVQAV